MNDAAQAGNEATTIAGPSAAVAEVCDRLGKDMTAVKAEIAELSRRVSDAAAIAARDKASSIGGVIADAIERRPVASLALSMAVGFLIGAALRR